MEEAEIKICEVSGEKVDNKVRLDVLKKEEQMIAEENEELLQEEEDKKKKVTLAISNVGMEPYFDIEQLWRNFTIFPFYDSMNMFFLSD